MGSRICIEACIASVQDAVAAFEGGADRLELNTALSLDGLTPSLGLLREVKKAVPLPIIVMIRPRSLGFVYSEAEFSVMQADIDAFLDEGIAGCAFGILTQNYEVDVHRSQLLVNQMNGLETVFHRAFDVTANAKQALESLIDLGIDRVLTSGHMPTAIQGTQNLKQLHHQASGRIEILPGSGIKPKNVVTLLNETACTQIHGSFRPPAATKNISGLDTLRATPREGTSKDIVHQLRTIIDRL